MIIQGVGTLPTILRNAPIGGTNKRDGIDPIDYADLFVTQLDPLHQRADDLATRRPVNLFEPLLQPGRELRQFADHEP